MWVLHTCVSVHCVHPLLSDQQRVLDLEVELEKVELLLWVLDNQTQVLEELSVLTMYLFICLMYVCGGQ